MDSATGNHIIVTTAAATDPASEISRSGVLPSSSSSSPLPPSTSSSSLPAPPSEGLVAKKHPEDQLNGSTRKEEEEDPLGDVDTDANHVKQRFKILTLLQWIALFLLLGAVACSLAMKPLKGIAPWGLALWKLFTMALVLFCGRLVVGWLIRILLLLLEKNSLLRKKVLYFVYGLRSAVQNCVWFALALLAWKLMVEPAVQVSSTRSRRVLSIMTDIFECLVVGAFIWLGKLLIVKSFAASFHVSTFFDRLQESANDQHILEALSGPPLQSLYLPDPPLDEENPSKFLCRGAKGVPPKPSAKNTAAATSIATSNGHVNVGNVPRKDASPGMMDTLVNIVKHPGFLAMFTTIDEEVDDFNGVTVNGDLQAKALAKRIFRNVAQPDSKFITREDLRRFLDEDRINKVLSLFDGAKDTGQITKKALKGWVVKVYQDKMSLSQSLNDTKTAVDELHKIANVIVSVIIIVVWLLMLGLASTKVLLFVGTQLLLVGFMFGNTLKQIFESIVFLFAMHPYDVGDRCIVDGVQLVVKEMNILTTVFLKRDNEMVFYPNSTLLTKPISNLYRSPEMKDFLDFAVHISTSTEQISALKDKIAGYVEKKKEHWRPQFSVIVKELEEMNRLQLSVSLQHTINFQNFAERMSRRSEFLLEMKRFFSELGIEYRLLPQPLQILSPYPSASTPQFINAGYPYYQSSSQFVGAHVG